MGKPPAQNRAAVGKKVCRFCGADMPIQAVRCNACELHQDWEKSCINCGSLLPATAQCCKNCESYQDIESQCLSCGTHIPKGARVCPKCGSVQVLSGFTNIGQVTLTLVIALLSVLGTVAPVLKDLFTLDRSRTHLQVVEMNPERELVIFVSNSGNQPSHLQSVRFVFEDFPQASREMKILNPVQDRLIYPGKPKFLRLEAGFQLSKVKLTREHELFKKKVLGGRHSLTAQVVGIREGERPLQVQAKPEVLKEFVDRRAG